MLEVEQPLQTLFLQDLRTETDVRFRPRLFLLLLTVGVLLVWAVYGTLLLGDSGPNPIYLLTAWGLIAGLLSFRWDRPDR